MELQSKISIYAWQALFQVHMVTTEEVQVYLLQRVHTSFHEQQLSNHHVWTQSDLDY